MKPTCAVIVCGLTLLCGCPQVQDPGSQSPATANIVSSALSGPAPLRVTFSSQGSTSTAGEITKFAWSIGGQAAADTRELTRTFTSPGRFTVTLTVTDSAGNSGVTSVDVRVQGAPPTAVIQSDRAGGRSPLLVRFDGTGSSAPDDTILDYFWNFGDGGESRTPAPAHVFMNNGTFTVRLRVVTGGGVEGSTQAVITVGAGATSLQFNGSQFANLPLSAAQTLSAVTFESWFNADSSGGALATLGGGALSLLIQPADGRIRLQVGNTTFDATAGNLAGTWRHVAVSYSVSAGVIILLDGVPLASTTSNVQIPLSGLTLGTSFAGKIGEVRLWAAARSATDIAAFRTARITTAQTDLLGAWPLDEGGGQNVRNVANSAKPGTLGASIDIESSDPAWSSDGPPLP